jgi:hypothetical protein
VLEHGLENGRLVAFLFRRGAGDHDRLRVDHLAHHATSRRTDFNPFG